MAALMGPGGAAQSRLLVSLDIGQRQDPTALAIAERDMRLGPIGKLEPFFQVCGLERVPLGTSYPAMVRGVEETLAGLPEPYLFMLDATGVGRPIVDLFREARLQVIAVTLTAGHTATQEERWDEWHLPKRDVVTCMQLAMQQNRFRVARQLPEAETLVKEARNFQWRPSKQGDDQYGAWRTGTHDDLLLACAILCWIGTQYAPVQLPGQRQQFATMPGSPFARPWDPLMGRR